MWEWKQIQNSQSLKQVQKFSKGLFWASVTSIVIYLILMAFVINARW